MRRRALQLAATAGLLVGAGASYWFHFESGIQWSTTTLRQDLASLGAVGPAVFVVAVALRPFLLLPSWVFLVAGGILFGTLWGTVWSSIGMLAGAAWVYGVTRGLGREAVERRMRGAIRRIDGYLGQHGTVWLAAYTAMPATPMSPAFAAAGLSSIPPASFLVATFVGVVPRCAVYTFFAASVVSGDRTSIVIASVLLGAALLLGWAAGRLWLRPGADRGGAG